jgi:hypothetical protein
MAVHIVRRGILVRASVDTWREGRDMEIVLERIHEMRILVDVLARPSALNITVFNHYDTR